MEMEGVELVEGSPEVEEVVGPVEATEDPTEVVADKIDAAAAAVPPKPENSPYLLD